MRKKVGNNRFGITPVDFVFIAIFLCLSVLATYFCADYNNIMIIESFMTNALRNIGVMRLMGNSQFVSRTLNDNPQLPHNLRLLNKGLGLETSWNRNVISEKLKLPDNIIVKFY